MKQNTIIAVIAILIIIIGAIYYFSRNNYGGQNTPTPTSTPQNSNQILIKNFVFNPAILNIKTGDTATWVNNDSAVHTISGTGFQSGDLSNGQSYSFTFTTAGTFDYICGTHPSMKGKIIVK